jgi:hypothetical protein
MRLTLLFRNAVLLGALAAPLGAKAAPDLVISYLSVTPTSVAPGGVVEIVSEIRNIGTGDVPFLGSSIASTVVHLRLVTRITDAVGGDPFPGWGPHVGIPSGAAHRNTTHARIPASKAPGVYFVCADADGDNLVAESDESNNRLCKALTVTANAARVVLPTVVSVLPDLTITDVSVGVVSGVSRQVKVTVRNAGTGPATNFRIDAYQLAPKRWPLLFSVCAHLNYQDACSSVWETGTLAANASRTYSGWVTFPLDHPRGSSERVEFMADGCFAVFDPGLPASCRVAESNESNNTWTATLVVP